MLFVIFSKPRSLRHASHPGCVNLSSGEFRANNASLLEAFLPGKRDATKERDEILEKGQGGQRLVKKL